MAPSMAANINPQASAATAGYAVPLTFLIAAVGVLLVAYTFVRLCQYYHHPGSVYAFVGATLGARAGVVAGWGLVGIWPHPPSYAPWFLITFILVLALVVAALPSRRGTNTLLIIESTTVALILLVTIVVFVRLIAGNAPGHETFTMKVFTVPHGISQSAVFLGVVFGFLSFADASKPAKRPRTRGATSPARSWASRCSAAFTSWS
jgi:amino acid transporter